MELIVLVSKTDYFIYTCVCVYAQTSTQTYTCTSAHTQPQHQELFFSNFFVTYGHIWSLLWESFSILERQFNINSGQNCLYYNICTYFVLFFYTSSFHFYLLLLPLFLLIFSSKMRGKREKKKFSNCRKEFIWIDLLVSTMNILFQEDLLNTFFIRSHSLVI